MKAAITPAYGPAYILETRELPAPSCGDHEILVQIRATPVTAGDRRLRAADFPGISALPGRLMMGVFRPRNAVQGTMFAGRVTAVGRSVTRFAVGDDVFGSTDHGAYAEFLAVSEDAPVVHMPKGLSYEEAAAVPYGAVTALYFLRDLADLQPGEELLILGASGGVGRFAVQLAKHMGATVTAVGSRAHFEGMRELGADHLIDYRSEDFRAGERRYDVILDIADASSFEHSLPALKPRGRYLTLFISIDVLLRMALTSMRDEGPQAKFGVAMGTREHMETIRELVEAGALRPMVAERFPLERIADAHMAAEAGNHGGTVVVTA